MSQPTFPDEKEDPFYKLLNDDFDAAKSATKLTIKTKTDNGTKIKVEGKVLQDNKGTDGAFEVKYKTKGGIELKEKWSTSNTFEAEVKASDLLCKGSEVVVKAKLPINKGIGAMDKSVKLTFGQDHWSVQGEFDTKTITARGAVSWKQWLFGAQVEVDTDLKPGNHTLVVRNDPDANSVATIYVENFDKVTGNWLQKLNKEITYGVEGSYTHSAKANASTFELVGKYTVDSSTSMKLKVNVMSKLANVSFKQKINSGTSYNASATIDPSGAAAPKLGLSISLGDDN